MDEHDPTCLVAPLEWSFVYIQAVLIRDVGHSCGHVCMYLVTKVHSYWMWLLRVANDWGQKLRLFAGMKVIRHAGVDSRMIILDDQARQQVTFTSNCHFNATFHPSQASLGIQLYACIEVTIGTEESFFGVLDCPK